MRAAHFNAFSEAIKTLVPELAASVHDGDVPLKSDGTVVRATYLVLHDYGFDSQDDERLSVTIQDPTDGTYRVVVRTVATTRAAVREVADIVKARLAPDAGVILTVQGRLCGRIQVDPGPRPVERDDDVRPPIFYLDTDYTFRSQRA